jgi:glycosyltransferase involved in cell wall biosynthesis
VRVGLNLLYLVPGRVGGTEVYARRLVHALGTGHPEHEFVAFTGVEAAQALRAEPWPRNVRVHRMPIRAAVKPLRAAAEQTLLPLAARRSGVDLLHSLGTTTPIAAGLPSVVTLHDIIYAHYPETFPTAARLGLQATVGPGARAADRVITSSEATRREIVEHLGVPGERIDVVPLGFGREPGVPRQSEATLRAKHRLGEGRVVLCVSAALRHKNLPRLIDAIARLGPGHEDVRLVLAGHAGREHDQLAAHAGAVGLGDRLALTGWVADEELEGLYALASCCVYPSLHEGFGLPVLEAMARGVPLACADATSLPEVAGDAAELFDPRDVDAIAGAVRRLLGDRAHAQELAERGRRRVPQYTWERCAAGCWATYERVLAG